MDKPQKRNCLVLMPFDAKYLEVYELVYKPVCHANEINCYRIDEIAKPGSITRDIVEGIIDADVIIADLTSKNSNVFYELGIAHSTGNKTIMTCQKGESLPFDIANYRVIFYEQSIQGAKELSQILNKSIHELLATLNQTNNPVQDVVSRRSSLGLRKKIPIVKLVNIRDLNKSLIEMFRSENIVENEDLRKIDLEFLSTKYNLGKASKEKLVKIMLDHDLYDDSKPLQEFVIKHRLHTTKTYKQIARSW